MKALNWTIIVAVVVIIAMVIIYENKLSKAKDVVASAVTGTDTTGSTGDGSTPTPTPDAGTNPVGRLNTQN